ncbi:T-cell surface glycoprotein CD3 zeta chain-like isoform X2 [Denticeps clupeoides]|uniref:T-cell surface glycoprotein CD3 zeta chain-like isoform X2 n=1 Tax=Denticeps clupeoides TaxID=299321 RepID=UPI0010A411D6|nr:T-cell surface glycoprotein CD3 zeta chain-like isoform X2 [Denticeps clupeoides]
MIRKLRTGDLLVLTFVVHSAASVLSHPEACYILDGILLMYCITLTALYFRVKLARARATAPQDGSRRDPEPDGRGEYEAVGIQNVSESGTARRPRQTGTAEGKRGRKEKTYESLTQVHSDDYESLEMRRLPPRTAP